MVLDGIKTEDRYRDLTPEERANPAYECSCLDPSVCWCGAYPRTWPTSYGTVGDVPPTCAHCDATDDLRADHNGTLWCLTCAVALPMTRTERIAQNAAQFSLHEPYFAPNFEAARRLLTYAVFGVDEVGEATVKYPNGAVASATGCTCGNPGCLHMTGRMLYEG